MLALLLAGAQAAGGRPLLGGIAGLLLLCVCSFVRRHNARVTNARRIEGVQLAFRTLRHHLGNRLAITVGYSDMLAEDPRLPEDLGEHAAKIASSARAAIETVDKLQRQIVRVRLDASTAGPPLLDVDASTSAEGNQTRR